MGDEVGDNLATDLWIKSVISALTAATTLVDVKNELAAYKAQADGWLMMSWKCLASPAAI
jgi:hypothetical protein